jgi:hypothetical protein
MVSIIRYLSSHLSGNGATAGLHWPARLQALRPKITLSLETGSVIDRLAASLAGTD